MKPWEKHFVDLYQAATKGTKRYLTVPLILVFIALPSVAGFLESYQKVYKFSLDIFTEKVTSIDLEERDLLESDEWGLIIHSYSNREEALVAQSKFRKDYFAAKHLDSDGEHIWQNDILVVRDPRKYGNWLLAIDMYKHDYASEQTLIAGVKEMLQSETSTGVRGQPLQRWLAAAKPYKFTKAEFEKAWGQIDNL